MEGEQTGHMRVEIQVHAPSMTMAKAVRDLGAGICRVPQAQG